MTSIHTRQRDRLRAVFAGSECVSPASVFDPLSARAAASVGYRIGMLAGSVASHTTLAAPDLIVLTLTEFADQVRRIMRACDLSLIVDADHGYGNALNVMRTVQELEHAGVSALSIEDTALPSRYGLPDDAEELIAVDEMVGKLRAAVSARRDPSLILVGRTGALSLEGTEKTVARVVEYAKTGVDAIFLAGLKRIDQIQAVHAAVSLPLIVGLPSLKHEDIAPLGVRILLQGHQPVAAAVKALRDTYIHLYRGGAPGDLKPSIAAAQDMDELIRSENYKNWQRDYLG